MLTVNQRGATDRKRGEAGGSVGAAEEEEASDSWPHDDGDEPARGRVERRPPHGARGGPHVHTPQGLPGWSVAKLPRYYLTVDYARPATGRHGITIILRHITTVLHVSQS